MLGTPDLTPSADYTLSLHDALPIYRDFLPGIIRRGEKREALHVIPMKVSERDDQVVLVMPNLAHVPAEIAKTGSGINKDRKSTRLNSSHITISYAVFCFKKTTQTRE